MIEERQNPICFSNYIIILLLDIRIHINTFSRAKYFPNRMMNELDKKYVQFNHIDQWNYFWQRFEASKTYALSSSSIGKWKSIYSLIDKMHKPEKFKLIASLV